MEAESALTSTNTPPSMPPSTFSPKLLVALPPKAYCEPQPSSVSCVSHLIDSCFTVRYTAMIYRSSIDLCITLQVDTGESQVIPVIIDKFQHSKLRSKRSRLLIS